MSRKTFRVANEYYHPWPNSAGFHVARSAGWYAESGIEMEFVQPDPGIGDGLEYLQRGAVDLAVVPLNRLLQRRATGQRHIAVAAVNQRGLETVRTVEPTGIRRLRDLSGRRIGLNPTPRGLAVVKTLVARDGGDPGAVTFVDLGTRELTADEIADGFVDATFGSYWAWDNLRDNRSDAIAWNVDEHLGLGYHSYVIGAHESILENRQLVQAFLDATARGYETAAADPDSAAHLYEQITPYFSRGLLLESTRAIATSWLHAGRWGALRTELIGPYASWLADHAVIADPTVWRAAVRGLIVS